MGRPEAMELTEDEAELYDRQIRLWGVESQKKLRNAKILIIGMRGLGAEVAKNIILGGVKEVHLHDHEKVTETDLCANFLIPRDAVGKNRAEASLEKAQLLNPMVKVVADSTNISTKDDSYFADFDIVVALNCKLDEQKRLNTACRLKNVKFYSGDVNGMFGYFFADLLMHNYTAPGLVGNEPIKKIMNFVPLVEAINTDWLLNLTGKKKSKFDPTYVLMLIIQKFWKENGRLPEPATREGDIIKLKIVRDAFLSELSINVPDSLLGSVFGEVSPTCAIVGGILAHEIIRAVSENRPPINNFFFFNPDICSGHVETVGYNF